MALPPEPIEEVLPLAALVIEAEVEVVLATGEPQPKAAARPGATGVGAVAPDQTVRLKVTKVHKGPQGTKEVVVQKPVGGYALRTGNKGPFLLDASTPNPVILGRYGPDTWGLQQVLEALAGASK